MQEEITQRTVSLSVEAGKMTADLLQKAVKKVLEEMQKKPSQRTLHQGKQTLHQLKQHGASLTNIEITEQNIKAFSVVAKMPDGAHGAGKLDAGGVAVLVGKGADSRSIADSRMGTAGQYQRIFQRR